LLTQQAEKLGKAFNN